MAHTHIDTTSASGAEALPASKRIRVALTALMIPLVVATGVGAAFLWPNETKQDASAAMGPAAELVDATVSDVRVGPCQNDPSGNTCLNARMLIDEGYDDGRSINLEIPEGPGQPVVEEGDGVVLGRTIDIAGSSSYYFSDFQRSGSLMWLAAGFAALVGLVARWRGVGALIGLAFTWLVITFFMLPSMLEGNSPVLVAITGSAAIVFVVLYVAHGFNARTTTAVVSTMIALVLTAGLSALAVQASKLTGFSSEETAFVQDFAGGLDIQGLILAGIVLGALGVLNDMTVSQTSTVREVYAARPKASRRELYSAGMRVGRDHIASTVYTLVLAYVGASLPLLILFTLSNRAVSDVVTTELVGGEIVRTLVGSIGLILSVPIATALAAVVERSRLTRGVRQSPGRRSYDRDTDDTWGIPMQPEPSGATPDGATEGGVALDSDVVAGQEVGDQEPVSESASPEEGSGEEYQSDAGKPKKERRGLRRQKPVFDRRMSRREKKFWEED